MLRNRCRTCLWWHVTEEERALAEDAECHGAPPVPQLAACLGVSWPVTSGADFCAGYVDAFADIPKLGQAS